MGVCGVIRMGVLSGAVRWGGAWFFFVWGRCVVVFIVLRADIIIYGLLLGTRFQRYSGYSECTHPSLLFQSYAKQLHSVHSTEKLI